MGSVGEYTEPLQQLARIDSAVISRELEVCLGFVGTHRAVLEVDPELSSARASPSPNESTYSSINLKQSSHER